MQLFRSSNEGDGSSWLHWVSCIIWFAFRLLTSSTRLTSFNAVFLCLCSFLLLFFKAKVVSYVQDVLWVDPWRLLHPSVSFLSSLVTPNTKVNKMAAPKYNTHTVLSVVWKQVRAPSTQFAPRKFIWFAFWIVKGWFLWLNNVRLLPTD